jgi:hypothetical protein
MCFTIHRQTVICQGQPETIYVIRDEASGRIVDEFETIEAARETVQYMLTGEG